MNREIARQAQPPKLNIESIKLLTDLCFRKDDFPNNVDYIFCFGSTFFLDILATEIIKTCTVTQTKHLILTSGLKVESNQSCIPSGSEALFKLIQNKVPQEITILQEHASTNTRENVIEALKVHDFTKAKSILFIFPSYACGRGYLTLRKFCPDTIIYQHSWNKIYPEFGTHIDRDTWANHQWSEQRVWGEFLRIKLYGERGDIAYDEVKNLVARIDKSIAQTI